MVNREPTGFGWIENMQDMTPSVCSAIAEGATGSLRDIRDGKIYWVGKLKDGNCWMTQNLDLDLYANGTNRKLASTDSDVSSDWISTTGASGLWNGSSSDYNVVKYYDPGDYVYTTPTTQNSCRTSSGLVDCADKGWQSTSGMSASNDPNFASVVSGNIYNAHYLAGNYYSWGAATAGQAASINTAGESTQSICPKGWRLPYSKDNTTDKSFGKLLTSYGTNSGLLYGTQDIRLAPLYFVYGGYVGFGSSLSYAGGQGFYGSSTASSSGFTYSLNFDTDVNPSSSGDRYYGRSVRCVAR